MKNAILQLLDEIENFNLDDEDPDSIQHLIAAICEFLRLARLCNLSQDPGRELTEQALAMIAATTAMRRDSAIQAELKQSGINPARMVELLKEAKEVRELVMRIGRRHQFDDDLQQTKNAK